MVSRIEDSKDVVFLRELERLMAESEKSKLFPLNKDQEKAIAQGRKDIRAARYTKNEEVLLEMEEWLKSK